LTTVNSGDAAKIWEEVRWIEEVSICKRMSSDVGNELGRISGEILSAREFWRGTVVAGDCLSDTVIETGNCGIGTTTVSKERRLGCSAGEGVEGVKG
jgi:hypothetical protein